MNGLCHFITFGLYSNILLFTRLQPALVFNLSTSIFHIPHNERQVILAHPTKNGQPGHANHQSRHLNCLTLPHRMPNIWIINDHSTNFHSSITSKAWRTTTAYDMTISWSTFDLQMVGVEHYMETVLHISYLSIYH